MPVCAFVCVCACACACVCTTQFRGQHLKVTKYLRWKGGGGGRDGCDGNYEVGAYGIEWVHNREPE